MPTAIPISAPVVGATYKEQAAALRGKYKNMFFLIPGYGAQGAGAEDIEVCFDSRGLGGIVNNSRGLLCAYKKPEYSNLEPAEAARKEAEAHAGGYSRLS